MKLRGIFVVLVGIFLVTSFGFAKIDLSFQKLKQGKKPSQQQIIAGLREALQVGTGNAVGLTGCPDGYFGNPLIKIALPETIHKMEKSLRKVGYGKKVDEFVLSMNRAAEQAAPSAKQIFWDAIKEMSFDDARKVLTGNDTAATDYFKTKTSAKLAAAFQPAVTKATNEVGVTLQYKELATKAKSIPYLKVELVDIDQYVVSKALDGLFYMVGEEERKIRKDPVARVTDLLKLVFGNGG